ncbi:MAG: hypothetical protein JRJ12_10555 [Deltaproteobacteria bacterium]|nr:hypothetical protein [Deltaproteobacteria bacterium]MBW2071920.1 hypothetical protein [Deltaproteobacteria bacterium]
MAGSEEKTDAQRRPSQETWQGGERNDSLEVKVRQATSADRTKRTALLKDHEEAVLKALLENPEITEMEILSIASNPAATAAVLTTISENQQWMKNYQVRVALVRNPRTPVSIAQRVVGTLHTVDLKRVVASGGLDSSIIESARQHLSNLETQQEAKTGKTVFQKIKEMSVPERLNLAMSGDKEARSLLIKDSDKKVQEAVLENPRITETEIVTIANTRTASEEVLRKICTNRQWMKNYRVRLGLVNNPKTPLPIAVRLLSTLMVADLKRLAKSKGIPNVLAQSAHRILSQKRHG